MESSEPPPPGEVIESEQNESGHSIHAGHSLNSSFSAPGPPPFWSVPPPRPPFCGFGPRPYPFPPFPPYGYVPPMFRVPPPSPSLQHSPIDKVGISQPTDNDQAWVKSWIESKNFQGSQNNPKPVSLSISDARGKMKYCLKAVDKAQSNLNCLKEGLEKLSEDEWNQRWSEAENQKSEISDLIISYFSGQTFHNLQRKQLKQMKKRQRHKRHLADQKRNAYIAQLRCQSLHRKADAWLADMQLTVERARRDEELKKEADAVLAEVTRRQSEGRRQIALLEALRKLHQARLQEMDARGSRLSSEDRCVSQQSSLAFERLLSLWSKRMEEYAKEEYGLRVMLEESAAKQSDLEIQTVRRVLAEWEKCLFGPSSNSIPEESLDMSSFVSIRYAWDQYLVPNGVAAPMASTIPVGWVLPTTPSSSEWQQFLICK